jgi:hypothetical protein
MLRNVMKLALIAAMIVPAAAMAADATLSFIISGTRYNAPVWQNGASSVITDVTFDFSGFAGAAAANVDSDTTDVKIIDPADPGGSKTIALTRPSTCTIGAQAIGDADVLFMEDAAEVAADGNLTFTEGATKSIGLRIDDGANHGDKTGAVSCAGAGSLVFTY